MQHQSQVAADRECGAERLAGAKIVRAGIDAAPFHADHVRLAGHGRFEGRFGKAVSEDAASRDDRFQGSPPVLARRRLRTLRSEEHTSELQSLMRISYAVFCLQKKKIYKKSTYIYATYNKDHKKLINITLYDINNY